MKPWTRKKPQPCRKRRNQFLLPFRHPDRIHRVYTQWKKTFNLCQYILHTQPVIKKSKFETAAIVASSRTRTFGKVWQFQRQCHFHISSLGWSCLLECKLQTTPTVDCLSVEPPGNAAIFCVCRRTASECEPHSSDCCFHTDRNCLTSLIYSNRRNFLWAALLK